MRRVKSEIIVSILDTLINFGPMRLTKITYKANINYLVLKEMMRELVKDNLVEERKLKENVLVYAATPKAKLALLELKEIG